MRRGVEMKYMITILCDLISTNYSLWYFKKLLLQYIFIACSKAYT
jgi:hypothetical protein